MAKKKRKRRVSTGVVVFFCIIGVLVSLLITEYSYLKEKYTGNHREYSEAAFASLNENSLEYKIAKHFFTEKEADDIRHPAAETSSPLETGEAAPAETFEAETEENNETYSDGVYLEHIYGGVYEGYMMVIPDPSQVFIGLNWHSGTGQEAPKLDEYMEHYNAIGGINGGGFMDAGGVGNGDTPAGIVIQDGQLISGGGTQAVIGFTKEHKLITAYMTAQEALDAGIEEAVTFGPIFITNGEVTYVPGTDTLNNANPRTAIGQKEDGTILLLVIDGRGPSSFGAKYEDVVKIFQDYGAVMAANLDGGHSSVMKFKNKYVNYPAGMYNSRALPDAILVKEKD